MFRQFTSAIQRILLIRSIAIFLQIIVFIVVPLINQQPLTIYLLILSFEILFHLSSIKFYRRQKFVSHAGLLLQIVADIAFLTTILWFSGGATNAFVSLLLIPIVMAAISLPVRYLILVTLLAMSAYTGLMFNLDQHAIHHSSMESHFYGMWVNFVISALVFAFIVGTMAVVIENRQKQIIRFREQQLRNEQLMSVGTASAQLTHHLATPLATAWMLLEQLQEDHGDIEEVQLLQASLYQCRESLEEYRDLAVSIREGKRQCITIQQIVEQLIEQINLLFPDIEYKLTKICPADLTIENDGLLVPALLNLIQNAIRASKENGSNLIELSTDIENDGFTFAVTDNGLGIDESKIQDMGQRLQHSDSGFGMAVMLTNATLERLGGSLTLFNKHYRKGCIAKVWLPFSAQQGVL